MPLYPTQKPLAKRPFLSGSLFWLGFSLLAVLLRGVRWDENYEFAQVILGQVPYPDGHPLLQYVRGFYSLQTYSLAGLMYLFPGPLLANFLRNWAFLAASTVPVFLFGTLFSRRQLAGHMAALFILLEVHVSFYSSYPIHVWPGEFSNGPIGQGYMLATLWALLDLRFRLAGFMLGLAPAIHLGQFPPLLATATLYAAYLIGSGQRASVLAMLRWVIPGLALSLSFLLAVRWFSVPPPADGPYFTPVDPGLLWHTYMDRYASHRAIPYTTGHLALAASVLVAVALPLYHFAKLAPEYPPSSPDGLHHPPMQSPRAWAAIYGVLASSIVWVIMGVHALTGADVPYLLSAWLPYRLMNHVSPVLIPLLLGICYDRDGRIPFYFPLLLLAAILAPLAHLVAPHDLVQRYLAPNAFLYFLLAGAAAGTGIILAWRKSSTYGAIAAGTFATILAALGCFHQFGAACAAIGILFGLIRIPGISNRALQVSSTVLACLLLLAVSARQRETRRHLPHTAFHREVRSYLDAQGEGDAMILVPYMQIGEQMKLGHPVMADMATIFHGVYRPSIAPATNALFEDFYGMSMDPNKEQDDPPRAWHEVWPAKSLEEWQGLAEKYQFRYVAAPSFMSLPLDPILGASGRILYRIPD